MPRYVDADSAKEIYLSKSAGEQLDRVPTADVQEVKHGKWIENKSNKNWFSCSECGRTIKCWARPANTKYPYCHCGAKMDGDTND